MKVSEYKSYDDLPLFLNAAMVAKVLGISQVQVSRLEKKILLNMREKMAEGEE